MRSCLTKITKVFRKKTTPSDAYDVSESSRLSEKESKESKEKQILDPDMAMEAEQQGIVKKVPNPRAKPVVGRVGKGSSDTDTVTDTRHTNASSNCSSRNLNHSFQNDNDKTQIGPVKSKGKGKYECTSSKEEEGGGIIGSVTGCIDDSNEKTSSLCHICDKQQQSKKTWHTKPKQQQQQQQQEQQQHREDEKQPKKTSKNSTSKDTKDKKTKNGSERVEATTTTSNDGVGVDVGDGVGVGDTYAVVYDDDDNMNVNYNANVEKLDKSIGTNLRHICDEKEKNRRNICTKYETSYEIECEEKRKNQNGKEHEEEEEKNTYIDEYKTFIEDKQQLPVILATPYLEKEFYNFEETFNLKANRPSSLPLFSLPMSMTMSSSYRQSENRNDTFYNIAPPPPPSIVIASADDADIAKTPEEIEYETTAAAEGEDVITPLPNPNNAKQLSFNLGRNMQPEIIEIIRNLDANALRINNLTMEDKLELGVNGNHDGQPNGCPQRQRQGRRGSSKKSCLQAQQAFDDFSDETDERHDEVILRRQLSSKTDDDDFNNDAISSNITSSLYERRQPKTPKLKLFVKTTVENKENKLIYLNMETSDPKKNLMDLKYPTVLPPNPQLKALLVFHKTDNICEVMTQACHRQQLEVAVVKTKEAAMECLTSNINPANLNSSSNNAGSGTGSGTGMSTGTGTGSGTSTNINASSSDCYHLIIIDARSSKYLDAEYITRSIRHTNGHHFTTIIAVVKKSFFEKDDVLIALLDAGVNRCTVETTNLALCSMELKQILHSIVRPHNVMSTQQALYTALHRLKEVLIITDDVLRIQYANKSAERMLNMRLDEIISKPLADIFVSDVSSIGAHGKIVREFDGILTVRRKSQDGIPMHVRVVPVACIGRVPTHYIFNFDVPGGQTDFIATLPQPKEAPRGSLHSIRRGSFDVRSVASDGLRRTSLAKLTSLPLEAPITKIINLLSQVQENCSADEARLIDKVLEFLKREGLYSPQMKEIRPDDPIATDLIGALLTGPSLYSSRRSSNDSIIRISSSRPSGSMPAKMKATPLIMELLEESLSWEFDMFKLEEITEKRPLLYLGMEMFRRFDLFDTFNVDESVCKGWLAVIEANYHAQNSYHNSTHAADVMQATGAFLTQLASKDMGMDRMDEVTALIAAAAHDIDHPGRSSAFLCNSNSPLAILYNDLTVLESHHAATTFKLTLEDDKINIFKNLDKETYKSVRSTIIDMILATEMTRHFEHLAKFVSVFGTDVEPRDIVQSEDESSILIRRMLIKVADVSNPARPTAFCVEWARRIAEEYFMQTDEEKALALPIVMPMFDRATCSIPKSQIGFIEYIIQDMMHAWDSFIDMPQLITYMQINYSQWKKYEEQGILTLADIKSKQVTLNAKKGTCK